MFQTDRAVRILLREHRSFRADAGLRPADVSVNQFTGAVLLKSDVYGAPANIRNTAQV